MWTDVIGPLQLADYSGVPPATVAGAATIRQKGYEIDQEPDGIPNAGTDRE